MPYGRMQLVEVTSGPVERHFGLASVQLHTAAAATDAAHPGPRPGRGGTAARPAHRAGRGPIGGAVTVPAQDADDAVRAEWPGGGAEDADAQGGASQPTGTGGLGEAGELGEAAEAGAEDAGKAGGKPVVEQRLHPVTPLRRAWAPVAVLIGWAVHDPDGAQRHLMRLDDDDPADRARGAHPGRRPVRLPDLVVHPLRGDRHRTAHPYRAVVPPHRPHPARTHPGRRRHPARCWPGSRASPSSNSTSSAPTRRTSWPSSARRDAGALRAELLARAAGFAPETAHEVGEAPVRRAAARPARACWPCPSS